MLTAAPGVIAAADVGTSPSSSSSAVLGCVGGGKSAGSGRCMSLDTGVASVMGTPCCCCVGIAKGLYCSSDVFSVVALPAGSAVADEDSIGCEGPKGWSFWLIFAGSADYKVDVPCSAVKKKGSLKEEYADMVLCLCNGKESTKFKKTGWRLRRLQGRLTRWSGFRFEGAGNRGNG